MNVFSKIYLALWIALVVVELIAATTNYVPMDTMSENWWWLQHKAPILTRVALTVGLIVLWVHLVKPGEIK